MLVDFCDGRYGARINSDKVSADHHEVTNLVSMDWTAKRRGFIAESFIKPPVLVTVTLPCNIEIYSIVIDPKVGGQASSGFEIFTSSQKVYTSWLTSQSSTSKETAMNSSNTLFQQVGKTVLQTPGVLCFRNVQYRTFGEWKPERIPDFFDFPNVRDLRHHKLSSLSFVSQVSIRISRTIGGSAAGIQRLEVWGQPSRSCQTEFMKRLKEIYLSLHSSNSTSEFQVTDTKENTENKDSGYGSIEIYRENGVEVPTDFIDKITCDIMTIPMLLPSGENIDQSTLEKHNNNEASWGRPPSDPFTGIPFHGNLQAIPNASLKARIDKFILTHSHCLGHLPQTVGKKAKNSNQASTSKLIHQHSKKHNMTEQPKHIGHRTTNIEGFQNVTNTCRSSCKKRQRNETAGSSDCDSKVHVVRKKLKGDDRNLLMTKERTTELNNEVCNSNTGKYSDSNLKNMTHTDSLKSSLDVALACTLGSLPSFTTFSGKSDKKSSFKSTLCCKCNKKDGMTLYQGGCEHLLCRDCLTRKQGQTLTCHVCMAVWDNSDITRVHTDT